MKPDFFPPIGLRSWMFLRRGHDVFIAGTSDGSATDLLRIEIVPNVAVLACETVE
jgi:hypothetical protein